MMSRPQPPRRRRRAGTPGRRPRRWHGRAREPRSPTGRSPLLVDADHPPVGRLPSRTRCSGIAWLDESAHASIRSVEIHICPSNRAQFASTEPSHHDHPQQGAPGRLLPGLIQDGCGLLRGRRIRCGPFGRRRFRKRCLVDAEIPPPDTAITRPTQDENLSYGAARQRFAAVARS
jgi:hypothetical protein